MKTIIVVMFLLVGANAQCPSSWPDWFKENHTMFSQYEHKFLLNAYVNDSDDCEKFNKAATIFLKKRQDSINEYKRTNDLITMENDSVKKIVAQQLETQKQSFYKKNKSQIQSRFKHHKDRFGEYDYFEYSGFFDVGNLWIGSTHRIHLIFSRQTDSEPIAYFRIESFTDNRCFDDDGYIIFLLKNGTTVSYNKSGGFSCTGFMSTYNISDKSFSSSVVAIKINHGSHARGYGESDVSSKNQQFKLDILNNIEMVGNILYERKQ